MISPRVRSFIILLFTRNNASEQPVMQDGNRAENQGMAVPHSWHN
jgi:hypothetical protein